MAFFELPEKNDGPSASRRVLQDELAVAIKEGRAAVLTYRRLRGRIAGQKPQR